MTLVPRWHNLNTLYTDSTEHHTDSTRSPSVRSLFDVSPVTLGVWVPDDLAPVPGRI
jgi:hypothetical protein